MTDEEKAAASKQYYRKGKAARKSPVRVHRTREVASEEVSDGAGAAAGAGGNASGRGRSNADVASRQGKAGPSQPWSAQSPSGDKAAGQVSRQGNAALHCPLASAVTPLGPVWCKKFLCQLVTYSLSVDQSGVYREHHLTDDCRAALGFRYCRS